MLDLNGNGFSIGWSRCLYYIMEDGVQYAWGSFILGQLYHDIYMCVYRGYKNLGTRVTLLHVWVFEHIVVCRMSSSWHQGAVVLTSLCGLIQSLVALYQDGGYVALASMLR